MTLRQTYFPTSDSKYASNDASASGFRLFTKPTSIIEFFVTLRRFVWVPSHRKAKEEIIEQETRRRGGGEDIRRRE